MRPSSISTLFALLLLLQGVTAAADDGQLLRVYIDGVQTTVQLLSEKDKMVRIGSGRGPAIPSDTPGRLAIPDTVTIDGNDYKVVCLADSAFYGCSALEEVVLPSTLASAKLQVIVGNYAFKKCMNLRKMISRVTSPSRCGVEAFNSIAPDCELYVPVGSLSIYHAYGWTRSVFGGGVIEDDNFQENFCIENSVVKPFIHDVVYPDGDYSFTRITDYYAPEERQTWKDKPLAVRIKAPITRSGSYLILETCHDGLHVRSDTFMVGQRALDVWNLMPRTQYTYRLFVVNLGVKSEVAQGLFTTEGQVRMMKIDNMRNFRDMGGWSLPHGRHVKYDRLFRSAELAMNLQYINKKGMYELLKVTGIDVEIDFGDYDGSPVSHCLDFVRGDDYQILPYTNGLVNTSQQYKNCFEKIVSSLREGKKVLFHCSVGTDRTGTLAFLMEGLLGMSESDMAKEYELSNFYPIDDNNKGMRHRNLWYKDKLVDYARTFPGNTLNEKIEAMALTHLGISQKDIDDFRLLMTDVTVRMGDVNGDGEINASDIAEMVMAITTMPSEHFIPEAADINGDGDLNVADIVMMAKMIGP